MTDTKAPVDEGALDSILQGAKNVGAMAGNSMLAQFSSKHAGRVDNLTVTREIGKEWNRFVGRTATGKYPATVQNVRNFIQNQYGSELSGVMDEVLGEPPAKDDANGDAGDEAQDQGNGPNPNPLDNGSGDTSNATPDPQELASSVMDRAGEAAANTPVDAASTTTPPKETKVNGLIDQMLSQAASPANNAKISAALAERLKMVTDAPSAHRAAGFMYDMIQKYKEANPRASEMMMQMYKKMTPESYNGGAQNASAPQPTSASSTPPAPVVNPASRTPMSSPQNAAAPSAPPVRREPRLDGSPTRPNLSVVPSAPSGPRERTPTSFSRHPAPQAVPTRREPRFGSTPSATPANDPGALGSHRNERTPVSSHANARRSNVRPFRRDPPPLSRNMGESFVPDMKSVMKAVREVLATTRQSKVLKTPQAVLETVNNSPRISTRLYPAMSAIHESHRAAVVLFAKYLAENGINTKQAVASAYKKHFGALNELAGMGRDSVWSNAPEMASAHGAARMPGARAGAAAANPMQRQPISPYENPNGSAASPAQAGAAPAQNAATPESQEPVLSPKMLNTLFKHVAAYLLAHGMATIKNKKDAGSNQWGNNGQTSRSINAPRSNAPSGAQAQPAQPQSGNSSPSAWQSKTLSTIDREFHKTNTRWNADEYKAIVAAIKKSPDVETMRNLLNANPRLLNTAPASWIMRYLKS